ncbi:serine protease, partial [Arthrobacter sp. Leaf337]|uniref:serine protease n=1 Tax=Arthrobacter sp. Leaf337 TaxID=1736342 RepID=UPI001910754D
METGRAVLIRYRDGQGVRRAGSGLRIGGNRVLTAAHVAAGTGHTVILGSSEPDATVLVRSTDPEIDLAVLEISIPDAERLPPLGYARVDRDTVATIEGCVALGFPAFKKDQDGYRRSVQVNGFIPTAEGFTAHPGTGTTAGYLSLKAAGPAIRDRPPLPGGDVEGTPWAGMSGAAAFDRNDRILGVVRHHNPAEGPGTLAMTPIEAINSLPALDRETFWAALGVAKPDRLPRLPRRETLLRDGFRPLLQDPDYAVFAGRSDHVKTVGEFMAGPGGILAITAPAGLGKTALLASLVRQDPDRFAYHFFTPRYSPDWLNESFFLQNMIEQLDSTGAAGPQSLDLPALRARFHHHLDGTSGSPVSGPVLLLDGLDEVVGWPLAPYLLGPLPSGVHLIVTIRDTGQDWRKDYGIQTAQQLPLDGFDRDAVAAVFTATGELAANLIRRPGAFEIIEAKATYTNPVSSLPDGGPEIHGADPLYIRFLARDANNPRYGMDDLRRLPDGFTSYLDRWWQELRAAAGDQPVRDLFAVLAAALGPLARTDLAALVPTVFEDPGTFAADHFDSEVLPRIRRMITGNDTAGYALTHPRLNEYLGTRIMSTALSNARNALLDYCSRWAKGSLYALSFYPSHLAETDPSALSGLYRDAVYLERAIGIMGIDRVTGTLRTIVSTDLPIDLNQDLRGCLRLIERETRYLRPPFPVGQRGYVCRQLGLQALSSGDLLLAVNAREALLTVTPGQLVPEWTSHHSASALMGILTDHGYSVLSLAVTPDSTRVVTAGADGTARIWDLASGTELHALTGHEGGV